MPFLCMYSDIIFEHQAKRLWMSLSFGNPGKSLICIIFYVTDWQKQQKIWIWPFFVLQGSLQGTCTLIWSYPLMLQPLQQHFRLKILNKTQPKIFGFYIDIGFLYQPSEWQYNMGWFNLMVSWHISAYKHISIKSTDRDSMDGSHLKKIK